MSSRYPILAPVFAGDDPEAALERLVEDIHFLIEVAAGTYGLDGGASMTGHEEEARVRRHFVQFVERLFRAVNSGIRQQMGELLDEETKEIERKAAEYDPLFD